LIFTVVGTGICENTFFVGPVLGTDINVVYSLWVNSMSFITFSESPGLIRKAAFPLTSSPSVFPSNTPTLLPSEMISSSPSFQTDLYLDLVVTGFGFNDGGGVYVDSEGTLFVANHDAFDISKIIPSSTPFAIAGISGQMGVSGINGFGVSITIGTPWNVVGDTLGQNLYFSDQHYIWQYAILTGELFRFAGAINSFDGYDGDEGIALAATFNSPRGIWFDISGFLYIADTNNHRIRVVDEDLRVNTIAGTGIPDFEGDGDSTSLAKLNLPMSVYVDTIGNVFIADSGNARIRKISYSTSTITTFAGGGSSINEQVPAVEFLFLRPVDVKGDTLGNIFVAEECRILQIDKRGTIFTVIGNGFCSSFSPPDTSLALAQVANVHMIRSLWIDSFHNSSIYICEQGGFIRKTRRVTHIKDPLSQPSMHPSLQPTVKPSVLIFESSTLNHGLVAYYPFDGNAVDKSGNGNNGEMKGGVSSSLDRFGRTSHALRFDGSTAYVVVDGSQFTFPGDFAMSFWFYLKPNHHQLYYTIFEKQFRNSSSSVVGPWLLRGSNDSLAFFYNYALLPDKTEFFSNPLVKVKKFKWNHFVISKNQNVVATYLNGELQTSTVTETSNVFNRYPNLPVFIGARNLGKSYPSVTTNPGYFFNGSLDDLFFFNRSLFRAEVRELYNFGSPTSLPTSQPTMVPSTLPSVIPISKPSSQPSTQPIVSFGDLTSSLKQGLIGYYPFDGNTNDKSGNGNNGLIRGLVINVADRMGRIDHAMKFDGVSSYVEIINGKAFNFISDMSVSFWINPATRSQSNTAIVRNLFINQFGGGGFTISCSDTFRFVYKTNTGNIQAFQGMSVSPHIWTHMVFVKQGSTLSIYRNGVLLDHLVKESSPNIQSVEDVPLLIGGANLDGMIPASSVSNFFNGSLDDIFLFNGTLSLDEVLLLFNFHVPTSQPTNIPSIMPSAQPKSYPSSWPSENPTPGPSAVPTSRPKTHPTSFPSVGPTTVPSEQPSRRPSSHPSMVPFSRPSVVPTAVPSGQPSRRPSSQPSLIPSSQPTVVPTDIPAYFPSGRPSSQPSVSPTALSLISPSSTPTFVPITQGTCCPSSLPSGFPSLFPTTGIDMKLTDPTSKPSVLPSELPIDAPGSSPSSRPSATPQSIPSASPTGFSSVYPSNSFSTNPSTRPSLCPTVIPSADPYSVPSSIPTFFPTIVAEIDPTTIPTLYNSGVTSVPSVQTVPAPRVVNVDLDPSSTSVTVHVQLSSDGRVYLGIFDETFSSSVGINEVLAQDRFASIIGRESSFSVQNLVPSTLYSVYLVTISQSGTVMSNKEMTAMKKVFYTYCCREISISLKSLTLLENQGYLDFVTISVDYLPSYSLLLQIKLLSITTASGNSHVVLDHILPFSWNIASNSPKTMKSSLFGLQEGNYSLMVSLDGPGNEEFVLKGDINRFNFSVVSQDSPLPAPVLQKTAFADDGSFIKISFNSPAFIANTSGSFPCGDVFDFGCIDEDSAGSCRWADTTFQTILAYFGGESDCLDKGDAVKIRHGIIVKAHCPKEVCSHHSSWPSSNTFVSVHLEFPTSPVVPTITLSIPSQLPWNNCSSLLYDFSNSVGNAGRNWLNITTVVSSQPFNVESVLKLQRYLNQHRYQISPPLDIPSVKYFLPDTVYFFKHELCNFFGKCSSVVQSVIITSENFPIVRIIGSDNVSMKRSQQLLLYSSLLTQSSACQVGFGKLNYNWTISRISTALNGTMDSFTSLSKDPSKFLLSTYSLHKNMIYRVSLTVTSSLFPSKSSTASVNVNVIPGAITAVIAGNKEQNMRIDEMLILDAASSNDEDSSGQGTSPKLAYEWSCLQIQPFLSYNCSRLFKPFVSASLKSLRIDSLSSAAGASAQLTVKVSDLSGSRSSSVSVIVSIYQPLTATIQIKSNLNQGITVANQGNNIQLTAALDIPSGVKGNASWSLLTTGNQLNLASTSLTPLSVSFLSSTTSQKLTMSLVFPPNSLKIGASYSFALTCSLSFPGITSSSSLSLSINSAPLPGTFRVSPDTGYALIDNFVFSCSGWQSDHLPLTYQFSYLSQAEIKLIVRSSSILSYTSSILPSGSSNTNRSVICVADVFDSLAANRTVITSVKVLSSDNLIFSQQNLPTVTGKINENLNTTVALLLSNVDDIVRGTAIASFILNQANCSQAPNCTSLNRFPCYSTAHTCGACLSTSLIGSLGDNNEPCYDTSHLAKISTLPPSLLLKSCPGNCSFHGKCVYSSLLVPSTSATATSLNTIPTCYEGDLSCKASCFCNPGYRKSTNCELSDIEIEEKRKLRDQVIDGIVTYVNHQEVSETSIMSWINSINEISQSPNELSEKSIKSILQLTTFALSSVEKNGFNSQSLNNIGKSINAMASAIVSQRSDQAVLPSNTSLTSSVSTSTSRLAANDVLIPLKNYSTLLVKEMVVGQVPTRIIQQNFRFQCENVKKTTVKSTSTSGRRYLVVTGNTACVNSYQITLPLSSLESHIGYLPSSLNIPLCAPDNSKSMEISVISLASSLYNNQDQDYRSDSTSLHLSSLPCNNSAGNDCTVEITLNSNNQGAGTVEHGDNSTIIHCKEGDYSNHTVICSSSSAANKNYTVQCHGKEEDITTSCPSSQWLPTCQRLLGNAASDIGCSLIRYSEKKITCSCPLFPSNRRRKLMSSSLSSSSAVSAFASSIPDHNSSVTTVDVNYISLLWNIESNFEKNIVSAGSLTADDVNRSWDVIVTLCLLLGSMLAAMFFSYRTDNKVSKKVCFENKVAMQKITFQQASSSSSELIGKTLNRQKSVIDIDFEELARQSLPSILSASSTSNKSLKDRIWREVKRHHRWIGVIYHFSPTFPRILRVVSLSTNIIVMLFIQSLTYGLTQGDDGSCSQYHTEETCLVLRSSYGTGGSKCYWTPRDSHNGATSTTDGDCAFIQPDDNIGIVIFIAMFSAFITAPLSLLSDWIIHHIVAAPTAERSSNGSSKLVSVFPAESAVIIQHTRKSSMDSLHKYDLIVLKELTEIKGEIMKYRNSLHDDDHKEEFDCKFIPFSLFSLFPLFSPFSPFSPFLVCVVLPLYFS
jgi:hypothetical protein